MEELRVKASLRVTELVDNKFYKKIELAGMLGMTYTTFYHRVNKGNWSGKEINIIMAL
jgi:hypothetical protein